MSARVLELTKWVGVVDVQAALGCSRTTAYEHLRRAAAQLGRPPGKRGLLRVSLEEWEHYASALLSGRPDPLAPISGQLGGYRVPPRLPPCVYFLLLAGDVVYVGKTVNLVGRIEQHLEDGKSFDRVDFLPVGDRLEECEAAFIKLLRPPLNRRGLVEPLTPVERELLVELGFQVPR